MIGQVSSNNFSNFRPGANVSNGSNNCAKGDCFTPSTDSESAGAAVYGRMSFAKAGERGGDVNPVTVPAEFAYYACCDT